MEFHFQKNYARGDWSVFAFIRTQNGRKPIKIDISVLPEIDRGLIMTESCSIQDHEFPSFVKALKEAIAESGFGDVGGSAEHELKATKYHLEDFRKLVFAPSKGRE